MGAMPWPTLRAKSIFAQFNVHIPAHVDVKKIRGCLKMTQPVFAKKFGFSVGRVRD